MNAAEVFRQIGTGVLMSLGARNSRIIHVGRTVAFDATILPMTDNGRGTAARTMTVAVTLTPEDLYTVEVFYRKRGDRYGFAPPVVHYVAQGVSADQLPRVLLAIDYDGPELLNPRLAV